MYRIPLLADSRISLVLAVLVLAGGVMHPLSADAQSGQESEWERYQRERERYESERGRAGTPNRADRPTAERAPVDSARPRYDATRRDYPVAEDVGWGSRLGVGFTAGPTTFLVDVGLPYSFGGGVSVGPRLQMGLANEANFIAPTVAFEYVHDFGFQDSSLFSRIRPLVIAGIGFAWIEDETLPGDDSAAGFLFDFGVGGEYRLSERFGIASVADFNILPKKTLGESLVFTWQVVQLRMSF